MPPIKVLLVSGSFPPDRCGVGDYTGQLGAALAAMPDIDLSVLTTSSTVISAENQRLGVQRLIPDWSLRSLRILLREIKRIRPKIVHMQFPTQGYGTGGLPWLVPFLARLHGARVVQTWHEGFVRRDLLKFLLIAITPGYIIVVRKIWSRQFRRPFGVIARLRGPIWINSASTLPKSLLTEEELKNLRQRYGVNGRRLVVFFGFIHPSKRIEILFEIADPVNDYILIIGDNKSQNFYNEKINRLIQEEKWLGNSSILGFVDSYEAADLLKAADALVIPLQGGGGEWNTAILAGILQGTFVLTTSTSFNGYDPTTNTYYAPIDGVTEMRQALYNYAGKKRSVNAEKSCSLNWASIALQHRAIYRTLLGRKHAHLVSSKTDSI